MTPRHPLLVSSLCALSVLGTIAAASADDKKPVVVMETSMGNVTIELEPAKAPKTVANFLKYVDDGFYTNTTFHRVIPTFMIQGGGFDEKYKEKKTGEPVRNESPIYNKDGMSNLRGTIAMARTGDPHSATSQFFINLFDENNRLDTYENQGYTAFGRVIDGMDVVDKIAKVETTRKALLTPEGRSHPEPDVPAKPVIIKSIKRKS